MHRSLANITYDYVNIRNYAPALMRQGYAILDSQNLHIKIRRCNSEMLCRRYIYRAIPELILLSSIIYELSKLQ